MRKKLLALLLAVLMTVLIVSQITDACAGTYYVYTANGKTLNLRSPVDNSVIGNIPYGTKLETDENLSTELAAYVTYNGVSGYVKWEFLVKDPPKPRNSSSSSQNTAQQNTQLYPTGQGAITIEMIGGSVSYTDYGGAYSSISYDTPVKLTVTASKKPEYWVINGVRYDFEEYVPTSFTLDNAWESMTIEAVQKKSSSSTLLSPADIQNMRTGETLIVRTISSKLCHVRAKGSGAGGWLTEFDFTNDYTNRATNQREQGGQVSVRVRATIPSGKRIAYWRFDDAELDFDTNVTEFWVHTLNVSKTYEPVFGSSKQTATATPSAVNTRPQPRVTATPDTTRAPGSITTRPQPSGTLEPTATPDTAYYRPRVTAEPTATPESSTFQPGGRRPLATAEPTPTAAAIRPSRPIPTAEPTATPFASTTRPPTSSITMYTVTCSNCVFSGGGYSNATSGSVPEGTKITVTIRTRAEVSAWYVNGARLMTSRGGDPVTTGSITVTVSRNTTVSCEYR